MDIERRPPETMHLRADLQTADLRTAVSTVNKCESRIWWSDLTEDAQWLQCEASWFDRDEECEENRL
jgi:hypothetical protein